MTYANQDVHDGEWKQDLKDGKGTMKYQNGDIYKGEFKNDKMHGKGVFEYANGDIFKSIGEWKEGKKCGLFEDKIVIGRKVYYDNGVKLQAQYDEDTDTEDFPAGRR